MNSAIDMNALVTMLQKGRVKYGGVPDPAGRARSAGKFLIDGNNSAAMIDPAMYSTMPFMQPPYSTPTADNSALAMNPLNIYLRESADRMLRIGEMLKTEKDPNTREGLQIEFNRLKRIVKTRNPMWYNPGQQTEY